RSMHACRFLPGRVELCPLQMGRPGKRTNRPARQQSVRTRLRLHGSWELLSTAAPPHPKSHPVTEAVGFPLANRRKANAMTPHPAAATNSQIYVGVWAACRKLIGSGKP